MTPQFVRNVINFCQKNEVFAGKDKLVVGVSGGPDSLCLLHLLKTIAPHFELSLTVAHLNHQLRADAAQADEIFVRDIAALWALPFFSESQNVAQLATEQKQSIEQAARQARYTFLQRIALEIGATKVAVGHNADDQAETVLMHLLRGSGLTGLRGMRPVATMDRLMFQLQPSTAPFTSELKLIRPLLETPRSEIETYCRSHQLTPRWDASNQDPTFLRNRLRHELIPYLERYNPNIRQTLHRTAQIAAADVDYLTLQARRAWAQVITVENGQSIQFDRAAWSDLPLALKRMLLRMALQNLGGKWQDIAFEPIEAAIDLADRGQTGCEASLPHGLRLTVSYNTLVLTGSNRSSPPNKDQPYLVSQTALPLNIPGFTPLPCSSWQLRAELQSKKPAHTERMRQSHRWEAYLDADIVGWSLSLRPRQPGDVFFPLGLAGHRKKVKTYMIDQKIPVIERDQIPLLVSNNQIWWVCGYRCDERAKIRSRTRQVLHLQFKKVV